MMRTATHVEKYAMTSFAIRELILQAARHAEAVVWEIVNDRDDQTGEIDVGWGRRASRAEWLARRENVLLGLTDELGWRLDEDDLDATIAAERTRVHEELDAKWLKEETSHA